MNKRRKKAAMEAMYRAATWIIERQWTKGANARNKSGDHVSSKDSDACAWCMIGAVQRVTKSKQVYADARLLLHDFVYNRYRCGPESFNDLVADSERQVVSELRECGWKIQQSL